MMFCLQPDSFSIGAVVFESPRRRYLAVAQPPFARAVPYKSAGPFFTHPTFTEGRMMTTIASEAAAGLTEDQESTTDIDELRDELRREREYHQQVSQVQADIRKLTTQLEEAKGVVKRISASRDSAITELLNLSPDQPLLFSDADAEDNAEAWRDQKLSELEISEYTLSLLGEALITNLGDIDAQQTEYQGLTDIDGIGEVKATEIEDAITAYWVAHPGQRPSLNKDDGDDEKDEK